ncbi:MAG: PilZ domain-containing protein [Sphingomicrobium sp.]|nr:PilZ domain-containing protein [Sphingomonadales bacterium]
MEEQPVETTIYSLSERPPALAAERREGERHLTLYRVGSIMVDDRRELCLIKNISAGGMRIRAYCSLPVGKALSVELKSGQPISGKVSWVNEQNLGVTFDEPIDVIEILSASMDGPRPRMPRIEVDCHAGVREGASTYRMRACDVSQGGIKLQASTALAKGADVVVTLPNLPPQHGVLLWTEGGYCGITFNRLLPLPMLVGWLQEQRGGVRAAG